MPHIDMVPLESVAEEALLTLMNEPQVRAFMPLLPVPFTAEQCRAFVAAKQTLWAENGYGPFAFIIGGAFAGWGGLQDEDGDADFALVLSPKFWGWGRRIFMRVADHAFSEWKIPSITILFPPNRTNSGALRRVGFIADGESTIGGETFLKFRLTREAWLERTKIRA
ncbi:GNAT family N-acetyltransferase [Kordiimonas sp. SCSIO 12603]|uniref:GNAT family N-acetyltransferase n=1 Tax=Kordiimonas sp. SCSIO 12603 TaxID=2829596 RepID=UPI00210786C6|nr:GNAT family N-acetyltransferase [Kordiimonas sp. SCSIO 12603]UTW59409.1 GNAT family N-acetyltransferase [Kordiimonas sp. SCSIO 12603]